jgi:glycosyltransferase involved in cell wall biosynthesis
MLLAPTFAMVTLAERDEGSDMTGVPATRPLRVLIVTREFPNATDPSFAAFNRQQFAALGRRCEVDVLATIPWFPGARLFARWSRAGNLARVPHEDLIDGLQVTHPRYLHIPCIVRPAAGALYAASLAPEILRRRGQYDVLLGSWAFPDGVGAVSLARLLDVPAVIKVHGSDMNVAARNPLVAVNLRWALPRARRVIAVSRPLGDTVAAFGVPRERIDIVPNGVDGELFRPRDRITARAELGHAADSRRWLLYVGRLEEDKGVLDLLEAFSLLARRRSDVRLAIVGDGRARAACARAAAGWLGDRVLVAGPRPLAEVPRWMAACDALVLPSWAEGTPNVVLEALACGRRVVATRVGGTPELVSGPDLGELVTPRDPAFLAEALGRAADVPYDPAVVARAGTRHGWGESARCLEDSLRAALA